MEKNFINTGFPRILHGGDYNPEQWSGYSGIWDEDMRLMRLAGVNSASVGIFSWTEIEPEEGVYNFGFLDEIMDKMYENGIYAVLATPSGARPAWMSFAHPEVLRVTPERVRMFHGGRANHCFTSPYYREKTAEINRKLAERYKGHPALLVWHISNEYSGECHCDLCRAAFTGWLKGKYGGDLDELNAQYWTKFGNRTYTDWKQVEPPSPIGERVIHGLNLDWKRFVTHQTVDFFKNETAPLKEITPNIPVTTNMMGIYQQLDYSKFADFSDVISLDCYPGWHSGDDVHTAVETAFIHNFNRSLKNKPFMLMESTPSMVNWQSVNRPKRPGMHILSSLQAVANGADTVQYFQWRKSRGGNEKFHGAVVGHTGNENTRVFREVAGLGEILKKLDDVAGTATKSEVSVIFDQENRWAVDDTQGFGKETKKYHETCISHYRPFWENGVNADVIASELDFSGYKIVAAPMLYMIKPGVCEKIEKYVKNGGIIIATYMSGYVNQNDLCFSGGFPGGALKDVFGIWNEEIDSLGGNDANRVSFFGKSYKAVDYCEIIHTVGAEALGRYESDYYAGGAAVTRNSYGKGTAYYTAFRGGEDFIRDFYNRVIAEAGVKRNISAELPFGVTASSRTDGENGYIFLQNFTRENKTVELDGIYFDLLDGNPVESAVALPPYGMKILRK
jgi:beta-galactosidase